MTERHFGHIPGIAIGTQFATRRELADAGVHRPLQAGISGAGHEGADSIVVSGGYEDDLDEGTSIVYTGHGGNDPNSGKQIAGQELTRQNLALARNKDEGLPVRLTRGADGRSRFAPKTGYRYEGLFRVDDYWTDIGLSGYLIIRFLLRQIGTEAYPSGPDPQELLRASDRRPTTIQRIVRNTAAALEIKQLYEHTCQVCRSQLRVPTGPYAEGAHVRPLGRPHDGPDTRSNILCLCPNHHVLFDRGAFTIADDFTLRGVEGTLFLRGKHRIDPEHLDYHRTRFGPRTG